MIEESTLADGDLAALAQLPRLEHICLEDVPVTDACLVPLAAVPALNYLELYETRVTRSAALAFAAAHPHVTVGWRPPLSKQQLKLLHSLSESIAVHADQEGDKIVHETNWNLYFKGPDITEADVRAILGLGGQVRGIYLRTERLSHELIAAMAVISSNTAIMCQEEPSADDVAALLALPSVKVVRCDHALADPALVALKAKWGDKLQAQGYAPY
jgi:hypothetical protein